MKNKTMQEMNEQYRNCPVQVNIYEVNGRKYQVTSHFIGERDQTVEKPHIRCRIWGKILSEVKKWKKAANIKVKMLLSVGSEK